MLYSDRIIRFNEANTDLGDAIELLAAGTQIVNTYVANHITIPEDLGEGMKSLERFVKMKRKDELERQLKLAKQRRSSDRTAEERRKEAEADIARIEEELKTA